jgi:hypothetical protein
MARRWIRPQALGALLLKGPQQLRRVAQDGMRLARRAEAGMVTQPRLAHSAIPG